MAQAGGAAGGERTWQSSLKSFQAQVLANLAVL